MNAFLVDGPGPIRRLRRGEAPLPEPGPHDVRIEVHAAGINPIDWRWPARALADRHFPFIPGIDVAGRIEKLGRAVRNWRMGANVACLLDPGRGGAFADFVIAPAASVAAIPGRVGFVDAAALPCAGTAAAAAVAHLGAGRDRTVLVFGGGGGVGGFAIQLAHLAGFRVIATYGGHERNYVERLGADEALDWRNDDVPRLVRALTDDKGVDAIVDTIGRKHVSAIAELLAPGGTLATVAGMPDLRWVQPFAHALSVHAVAPVTALRREGPAAGEPLAVALRGLLRKLANGNIRSLVSEIVPIADLPEALHDLAAGKGRGKTVVRLRV